MVACLERVTGEKVPLDPAFYAAVEAERGDPNQGSGSSVPFSNDSRPKITITGTIASENPLAVDIDLRVPDPTAPGGMAGKGKILLSAPGPFEFEVPSGLGKLEVQAFQDIDSDGPNGKDPFDQKILVIGDENLTEVSFSLKPGARPAGPEHTVVAPAGEKDQAEQPGQPVDSDPFGASSDRIALSGTLRCSGDCPRVDLDLFQPDEKSPGGRRMIGKQKLPPGEYVLMVPRNFGPLILEAFIDFGQDGPGPGDKMGRYDGNPVVIGSKAVSGVDIELSIPQDGRMPMAPPPQRP